MAIFVKKYKMDFQINFKVNEKIYLRNPESSELGKNIIKNAIDLIYEIGFEQFTFKKLAVDLSITEATVYRYFENKHKLLLYILNWYWSYFEFLIIFQLQNLNDPKAKLKEIIKLLTHEIPESIGALDYNMRNLNQIAIIESSKVYLIKEVSEINKNDVFKPYKDLCSTIANVISEYNKDYKFPRSLSSTLIETAHNQQFFNSNLPRLTDNEKMPKNDYTMAYLEDLLFKILK
jgi:AcrR family transcriptional regulator